MLHEFKKKLCTVVCYCWQLTFSVFLGGRRQWSLSYRTTDKVWSSDLNDKAWDDICCRDISFESAFYFWTCSFNYDLKFNNSVIICRCQFAYLNVRILESGLHLKGNRRNLTLSLVLAFPLICWKLLCQGSLLLPITSPIQCDPSTLYFATTVMVRMPL